MLRNNPLLAQFKDQIRAAIPRVQGVIKATDKNFGFLETDDGKSYFVPPPAMKRVLDGDRVEATLKEDGAKTSAEPETLLSVGIEQFIGRVVKRDGRLGVVPDQPAIRQTLSARLKGSLDSAEVGDGDWVAARLVRHPLKEGDRGFLCQIEAVVATRDDPAVPWRITLARHGLEQACPDHGSDWLPRQEGLAREDLTDQPFFTIDSETTRDMDDALRVQRRPGGGWQLTVAVADPGAYLGEDHPADQEARARAFTVYLPGRAITMLPELLSHDLCSLVEGQERPVVACDIAVNPDGSVEDYRFCAATIRSHARLAYDQVSDWLEGQGEGQLDGVIAHQLTALAELTTARIAWRNEHAVRSQESPDYVFDLDDAGNVLGIRIEARRRANRMIEEAMIIANACGAEFLASHAGRGVFNVHQAFASQKLTPAREFLASQQIAVEPEALTELDNYRSLRRELDAREDSWLNARLRQFQGYSDLSSEPAPHFGLGLPAYATWTSPIRKYGDLVNQRLIKGILSGEPPRDSISPQLIEQLAERRRRNRLAERDVKSWLYVRFLGKAVKERHTFAAEIVGIYRTGMRVRLRANGAMAFVPAALIHADRDELKIDDKNGRVHIGEEVRFLLGGSLAIVLTEAREDNLSLMARPAEQGGPQEPV